MAKTTNRIEPRKQTNRMINFLSILIDKKMCESRFFDFFFVHINVRIEQMIASTYQYNMINSMKDV